MDKISGIAFSSMELSVLLKEPSRLQNSIAALQNQFDESMTRNYDLFIKTCESASTITDELEKCTQYTGELTSSLSKANEMCKDISITANNCLSKATKILAAFRHISPISDVLSVPQLMQTCKISQFYEEALQMHQAIDRFSHQNPNIKAIQYSLSESNKVKADVTRSLLEAFSGELDLQVAIRTVNLLRTANMHSEGELKLSFINGRRQRLQQKIDLLPRKGQYFFIEKLTELYRTILYEASTQYRALFSGEDMEDDMILHLAIHQELSNYCCQLKEALNQITELGDAKSIMQSALNFGYSFGRLGFNFCPVLEMAFFETKWAKR